MKLDQPSTFSGEIFDFSGDGTLSGSDQIDLKGIDYNTVQDSYANGVLTVTDGSGNTAKLNFSGSYVLANFAFASDGNGGTIVYDPPSPHLPARTPLIWGQSHRQRSATAQRWSCPPIPPHRLHPPVRKAG